MARTPGISTTRLPPNPQKWSLCPVEGCVMPKQKIIGAAYQDLKSIVKEYSQKDLPVLFIGETGCGKEVFIKYYFEASKRRGKKMILN